MEDYSMSRNVARYACLGGVQILYSGNLCWGRLGDISDGGCYIETLLPLPAGTTMQLRLTIAGNILDLSAKVIWTIPQAGMGVSFAFVSPQERDRVAQVIEDVKTIGKSSVLPPIGGMHREKPVVRISRDAELLAKITKHVDEKGVLTKQELMEMMDLVNAGQ
jgi:hypothetical protein